MTIICAPFILIVRKFAPFIAGIGRMDYNRFPVFDLMGAVCRAGPVSSSGIYRGAPCIKEPIILATAV